MSTEAKNALDAAINATEESLANDKGTKEDAKSKSSEEADDSGDNDASDDSGDDADDSEEADDEELDEASLTDAKSLYKLLKDPALGKDVVRELATRMGLLNVETPKETKAAKKEITALVKEALGPEYAFLSEKMGKVFEAVLAEHSQTTESRFDEIQQQRIVDETNSALAQLANETRGESKRLEAKMAKIAEDVKPGPNVSTLQYARTLYRLASADHVANKTKANVADKAKRNANDVSSRLAVKSTSSNGLNTQIPAKKMNLDESIDFAITQMEGKRK